MSHLSQAGFAMPLEPADGLHKGYYNKCINEYRKPTGVTGGIDKPPALNVNKCHVIWFFRRP